MQRKKKAENIKSYPFPPQERSRVSTKGLRTWDSSALLLGFAYSWKIHISQGARARARLHSALLRLLGGGRGGAGRSQPSPGASVLVFAHCTAGREGADSLWVGAGTWLCWSNAQLQEDRK